MGKTAPPARRVGRPADRQDYILDDLRRQIVSGQIPPGGRIPNRDEIGRTFNAGANTVQRALDRLREDGFVCSSGRNGTHVSLHPPHLTRYAVVFPYQVSSKSWVPYWHTLNEQATAIPSTPDCQVVCYYDVEHSPDNPDLQRLRRDVLQHRLAGIIFATAPHYWIGSDILEEPGIPRVGLMTPGPPFTIPAVHQDRKSFYERAFEYIAARGCRSVAVLNPPFQKDNRIALEEWVASSGLYCPRAWQLYVPLQLDDAVSNLTELLMEQCRQRPDALVIADDNLVKAATSTLARLKIRVPEDVAVVAHANFPHRPTSAVPVTYLGFDAREVVHKALETVRRMRSGEEVPRAIGVKARFDFEMQAGT